MSRNVSSPVPVEYPSSDGRPMAENDWQLHAMIDAINVLDRYFYRQQDAARRAEEARVAELEAMLREQGRAPGTGPEGRS